MLTPKGIIESDPRAHLLFTASQIRLAHQSCNVAIAALHYWCASYSARQSI
jgi:hypothetical protein